MILPVISLLQYPLGDPSEFSGSAYKATGLFLDAAVFDHQCNYNAVAFLLMVKK